MNETTDLANLMVATADLVCDCLNGTLNGRPGFCGLYWSTPPDDFDCGDCGSNGALFVWLESLGPSLSWPNVHTGPVSNKTGPLRIRANLAVRLIRPCWPVIQNAGGQPLLPSRLDTEEAAVNVTTDAVTMYCCILTDLLDVNGEINGLCSAASMGLLTPDRNRSGCHGATVRFAVDLGSCCVPSAGS